MFAQRVEGAELDRERVGRLEDDTGRHAGLERLLPAIRAKAPAVTRDEPGEAELRPRRRQVVADRRTELQELVRHHRADGIDAEVVATGAPTAVAPEPGQGGEAAGLERPAEHVQALVHSRKRTGGRATRPATARPSARSYPRTRARSPRPSAP